MRCHEERTRLLAEREPSSPVVDGVELGRRTQRSDAGQQQSHAEQQHGHPRPLSAWHSHWAVA